MRCSVLLSVDVRFTVRLLGTRDRQWYELSRDRNFSLHTRKACVHTKLKSLTIDTRKFFNMFLIYS